VHKFKLLLHFPKLYALLASKRKKVNYEKLIYLRSINKGNVIFDIGANIGNFTKLFSILCGNKGEVHCFEPIPETYHALLRGVNHLKNVRPHNIAAGHTNSRMPMSYDSSDSEKASLSQTNNTDKCEVEVIRLDDYILKLDLKRLDFVKCDVEGYELEALEGMKLSLRAFLPQICLEVTVSYQKRIEIVNLLKSLGYNCFRKVESGYPLYEPEEDNLSTDDYFYLHASSSNNS
jgi:FkbM family methyltransferase